MEIWFKHFNTYWPLSVLRHVLRGLVKLTKKCLFLWSRHSVLDSYIYFTPVDKYSHKFTFYSERETFLFLQRKTCVSKNTVIWEGIWKLRDKATDAEVRKLPSHSDKPTMAEWQTYCGRITKLPQQRLKLQLHCIRVTLYKATVAQWQSYPSRVTNPYTVAEWQSFHSRVKRLT